MASMGTPIASSSSFSASSWIYDVFLSFYGEDTRKGFIDHLHAALKRKGIFTFRDDEKLEHGKNISVELIKAIQNSQYAVVVISERYAFSTWCLNELTEIMKCRTKIRLTVLPVFYYVNPSDVRNQKGSFAKAFDKHGVNPEIEEKQINIWKVALKDVSDLCGFHVVRGEANIVETISQKIRDGVKFMPSNNFKGLVGIDSRVSKLISLLSIRSNDVCFIGVCGMGGIGKTTLTTIIYDRVSSKFEASCFVANVRKETQKHGVVHLKKQLVCEIRQERDIQIYSKHTGIDMIARSVRNRNVFIVLDDIDKEDQLEVLAGSHDWFGQGSRIVVTSRDRHLLKRHMDKIFEMTELSEDESLELFCWKAFKKNHPKENYVKLSKDIVHKLQISYEGLEDSQKRLFLDIACFSDRKNSYKLKCLHDYFDMDIEVLKDRCLIKDLDGVLMMHDLLKKMGQQIVYLECRSDLGKCSRLWCYKDIMNVLNCNTGTDTIEGINLDLSLHKQERLNLEGFSKMKGLKMLVIHNSQSFHEFHALEWYGDISNLTLSNDLRYLEWDGYPLENLPTNFQANRLIELKMAYSCIKQLSGWKNFNKVKFIDMSYSCNLIEIPDFNEMSNLVELNLQYCRSLSTVHSSLGNLKHLKILEMEGCDCLTKLPDEINLESLEYFNLAGCLRLEKLPNINGNMKSLDFLDLIGTTIKELPPSFKGLSSLKYFNLCGSMNYRKILDMLGDQNEDRFLKYDPSRPPWCSEPMRIIYAHGSGSDPVSFLRFLNDFSNLNSLKRLDLSYRNLSEGIIPYELCYLSSLVYLDLSGNKLMTIPFSVYLLPKLQDLYLRSCNSLKILPEPSFPRLSCLRSLHLGYCKMVDGVIPNDLSWFSLLKDLNLCNNKFRRLPNLIQLSQLSNLDLEDCDELNALPKLPLSLKDLCISGCVSLEIPWVEMDGGFNHYCAIGAVRFDYDGRLHQILRLPSYHQIALSSDTIQQNKFVYIVAPALVSKIPKWFNRRITNSLETVESCFQVCQFDAWIYCGGFVLLILYRGKPDTFQEKRKKQKVDESGKSNYGMFDGIDVALPHFLCHFQFNEVGAKESIVLCAPEAPSVGSNASWAHIPFQCFEGTWKLRNTKASVKASIESFNLNVEIECGMRVVNMDDLPELAKVISDVAPHGLDFETCTNLLKRPCKVLGFKVER